MAVMPIMAFEPVRDNEGKIVPYDQRGYIVDGKNYKAYSFLEAITIIKRLAKQGTLQKNFECVVVDTVDVLQKWSELYYIKTINETHKDNEKIASIGDIPHGAAWSDARDMLVRPLLELKEVCNSVGVDLSLLIHSKTTTQVANKNQRDPALRAGVTNALFGEVEAIGYIDVEDSIKPDGSDYGCVFAEQLHTVSFTISSEILTGGSRLAPIVNKVMPFSYKSVQDIYQQGVTIAT